METQLIISGKQTHLLQQHQRMLGTISLTTAIKKKKIIIVSYDTVERNTRRILLHDNSLKRVQQKFDHYPTTIKITLINSYG